MKVLVSVAGSQPAEHSLKYVVCIARKLNSDLAVPYIHTNSNIAFDAQDAFGVFAKAGDEHSLNVQSRIRCGSMLNKFFIRSGERRFCSHNNRSLPECLPGILCQFEGSPIFSKS